MIRNSSRILRAFALTSLLILPLSLPAADTAAEDSPLHQNMEKMGQTMRTLGRGLRNPDPAQKATYLESLQTLQVLAVQSKVLTPASVEKLPEAERPARLMAFRSDLAATIETMLQLERAILADEWENVKTLGAKIGQQRSDAHKKYNPEE